MNHFMAPPAEPSPPPAPPKHHQKHHQKHRQKHRLRVVWLSRAYPRSLQKSQGYRESQKYRESQEYREHQESSAYLSRGKYGYEEPVTVDEQLSAPDTLIGNLTIRSSHCDKDIVD